jgi:hypothetical protein
MPTEEPSGGDFAAPPYPSVRETHHFIALPSLPTSRRWPDLLVFVD